MFCQEKKEGKWGENTGNTLVSGALAIGGLTLLSRVLGFVRDALVALIFGAGLHADAFFLAFRVPNLFRKLFSDGVLSIALVPAFSRRFARGHYQEAWEIGRSLLWIVGWAAVAAAVFGAATAPVLVKAGLPGLGGDPEALHMATALFQVMMPYLVFVVYASVFMGMLHGAGHFTLPALAPVCFNVVVILVALVMLFFQNPSAVMLAWGVSLGGVTGVLIQWPVLSRKGFSFFRQGGQYHPGAVRVLRKMGPAMIGAAAYQVNMLVMTFLAARLSAGSISWLYYADRLVQFPLALFGMSVSTVVFPRLSVSVDRDDTQAAADLFSKGIQAILVITLPAMAGLIVLRKPVVSLLFYQGAFSLSDLHHTSRMLLYLALGLWAVSGTRLFVSLFHAFKDVVTPFRAGVVAILVNGGLGVLLIGPWGEVGLALSLGVASLINLVILIHGAGIYFNWSLKKEMLWNLVRSAVFSMVMAILVTGLRDWICPDPEAAKPVLLAGVLTCILAGIVSYAGLILMFSPRDRRRVIGWCSQFKQGRSRGGDG